jgi:hypothetical protein
MGGIAHAIGHVLKTGFDMTETGRRYNESKDTQAEAAQRLADQAGASVQHWQSLGGKLIHDGLVADDGPPGPDGTPTKIYRPVNPERYTAKVKAGKDTLQFEIPNDAEQHAYAIGRQVRDLHESLTNPTASSDRQIQQTETARGAGMTTDAQNRAKEAADERQRERIGIPIPQEIGTALGIDPNMPGQSLAPQPLESTAPAPTSAAELPAPARSPEAAAASAPYVPGKPRKLLPSELDNLATAAGKFVDYQSKADARLNPPAKAKTVHNVTPSADGKTQIITYTDGSIDEKQLTAGAKPAETETEITLAQKVAKGKNPLATAEQKAAGAEAELTLKRLDQSKREARPITVNQMAVPGSVEAPSTTAQLVADYKMDIAKALPYRATPEQREAFMKQVRAVNPNFDQSRYAIANKTEQDAITGRIGTQANALNTMMGHLGVLQQAALDLNNGDVQALNQIANSFGVATGSTPVTTFRTIVHRIGPEIGKAYVAGGGTAAERGVNEEDFADNKSPQQIMEAIGISASLADSKIKALQKQYLDGTGSRGKLKLLTDESEGIRQHLLQNVKPSLGGTKGAKTPPPGQVAVINPKGVPGFIPKEKLDAALAKGYRLP